MNNTTVNGSITKKDIVGKYVFWDIDGTLAPYRFNNHVADENGTDNGMSLKEIDEHVFLFREASNHMQKVVSTCGSKQNIIMGHCQNFKERDDKELWLNRYYPKITKQILTLITIPKVDTIVSLIIST